MPTSGFLWQTWIPRISGVFFRRSRRASWVPPEADVLTKESVSMDESKGRMPPMFLPGVENDPKPGPYGDAIRMMQKAGPEYPQIWHLFAFRPEMTSHLAQFTQQAMREPSPLTPGFRELIAAYISWRNHCPFWTKSHAAVAAVLLERERQQEGEPLVAAVLADMENSTLSEAEKAMLRLVDKVNQDSVHITAEDMHPLRTAGWSDEGIYMAITVCALFNFYNRWVDATGVHALSDEAHRTGGLRSANAGYVRK
jgi:uncharacterized peroxidase-related enzyme